MRIDKEAFQFFLVFIFIGIMILIFAKELILLSYVFFFLALFTLFFFRDPNRKVPGSPGTFVSPADGKIIRIEEVTRDQKTCHMVSIFMSVFNVHINRAPFNGIIKSISYNPGGFVPAFKDKASLQNEQTEIVLYNQEMGFEISFKMIAGLIARRIVVRVKEGQSVKTGDRVGLIRFGSRVDVFLPAEVQIRVNLGDRVKGGKSVIGELA